ncbi:MAG: triose-phosphate isomerase, partial [Candidatus Omnitrophota bacterium]
MINLIEKKQKRLSVRIFSLLVVFSFVYNLIIPIQPAYTQYLPSGVLNLPAPGTRLFTTPAFNPTFIQGITVHPENPLEFDFIVNVGEGKPTEQILQEDISKSINYFLAALTVPENEVWVNLSPYEKDLAISQNFGDTQMGSDLLAQDYMLKQLTASLMYPEEKLGENFWKGVYRKAQEKYGTTNLPITTFAKVWIIPDKAVVYEQGSSAMVIQSHLKVMLEEDYQALQKNLGLPKHGLDRIARNDAESASAITSEAVREFLVAEIEREVNEGKTFANLRQIYNSIILATWYKDNLQRSLLGQVYVDKAKTKGVDTEDKQINKKIYNQYVEAFKKGVFDYIKSDYDSSSQKNIRRRYFSGGTDFSQTRSLRVDTQSINPQELQALAGQQLVSAKINLAEIPEGRESKDVEKAIQMPESVARVVSLPKVEPPLAVSIAEIESQQRKPIIGGNLKREFHKDDIERLLLEVANELKDNNIDSSKADVFIAPQELHLERFFAVLGILEELGEDRGGIPRGLIKLGAQNVSHRNERGAFTGQHATAEQLKEYGVQYVIVGHSEARRGSAKDDPNLRYRETNAVVNAKVRSLIDAGLTPVIAFGETDEERQAGAKFKVVSSQVFDSIAGLTKEELLKTVLAYEPVWAIGTGQAAEKEKVNTMFKFIRKQIEEKFGAETAAQLRIIYGGSMKPSNVVSFVQEPNIDGGLIGGAAKKGEDFVPIMREFATGKVSPLTSLAGPILFDAVRQEEARTGKGAVVMATNIRSPLSLDGIMQAAKESDSVVVFQQAISEFDYTWPHGYSMENTYRFAEEIQRAGQRNGFSNYVLKADHITVKIDDSKAMKSFLEDKSTQREITVLLDTILAANTNVERETIFDRAYTNQAFMSNQNLANIMKAIKRAVDHVKSAVGAGFTIYALDASFIPMPINARATAFMAGFIPGNSSIEAEVGEIGGSKNSTIADALELITGIRYKEVIKEEPVPNDPKKTIQYSELVKDSQGNPIEEYKGKGLLDYGVKPDRIAINNGTA